MPTEYQTDISILALKGGISAAEHWDIICTVDVQSRILNFATHVHEHYHPEEKHPI
jgi:hypothetical protein